MNVVAIALIAFVALLFTPFPRLLIAALFGRQIARAALARQPDTIHLERSDPAGLRRAERVGALASEYQRNGFADAGLYLIPEMSGVRVQLFANEQEYMYGAIYDHPVAGVWFDVVSRYADGSAWSYSTARPSGLAQRPNMRVTNMPGTELAVLLARARAGRPGIGMRPATVTGAVPDFEKAYADYMAWLKQRGISTGEVVEVARRRVA